jgi:hypothetical protein
MKRRSLALAGILALALACPHAVRAEKAGDIAAIELSAQKHKGGKGGRAGAAAHRRAPAHVNRAGRPRANVHRGRNTTVIRRGGSNVGRSAIIRRPGARAVLRTGPGPRRAVVVRPARYWHGWRRPGRIVIYRNGRRFWVNNGWRTLVPIAAITGFAVGATMFYPDGYVPIPAPACTGVTADGCQLRWQQVPAEEGGSEFQCVQFCAQRDRTAAEVVLPDQPPAETAAPAEAPAQRTGCELVLYSEPEFKGSSAPTDEDQSDLSGDGWKDQIASVEVKSGTWDFFVDPEFGGDMMRLTAGSYPTLDAKWSRHIGSFMCSAPSGS